VVETDATSSSGGIGRRSWFPLFDHRSGDGDIRCGRGGGRLSASG
jgi:hypothetical protein